MEVTGTSGVATGAAAAAAKATANGVDYNAFLQLLIAQMKNQDPTNPTDSAQQLAQLASFSQVEQQTQTNAKLDAMLTSSALSQANAVIGRTLTSADGTVSGRVLSVNVSASGSMALLEGGQTLAITDGISVS